MSPVVALVILAVALSASLLFDLLSERCKDPISLSPLSVKIENAPKIVISVITSTKEARRVDLSMKTWMNHSLVKSGIVRIIIVISSQSTIDFNYSTLHVNCTDALEKETGLICRVDSFYKYVYENFKLTGWFYRALDDTWIDIDNLFRLLYHMESFSNPYKHIIFKGQKNIVFDNQKFLTGGTGWLFSRGYLEKHMKTGLSLAKFHNLALFKQDDTAQTMILNQILSRKLTWDCIHMAGFRIMDNQAKILKSKKFQELSICPADFDVIRVADVVSLHTFGHREEYIVYGQLIKHSPKNLCLFRTYHPETNNYCICDFQHNVINISADYLNKTTIL